MYKFKTTKLRHEPLVSRGHLEPVSKFGERLASDFIIVNKSSDGTKESLVQVIRDEHSGFLAAFSPAKHDTETVTRNLLAFLGPLYHTNPVIMCKSDNAKEFQASCNVLGFVHEPTLARRWPAMHNLTRKRHPIPIEEITRSVHTAAGFHVVKDLWKHSVGDESILSFERHCWGRTIQPLCSSDWHWVWWERTFTWATCLRSQRSPWTPQIRCWRIASFVCWMAVRFRTIVIQERVLRARLRKRWEPETWLLNRHSSTLWRGVCAQGSPVLPQKAAADEALAIFKNPNPEQLAVIDVPFSKMPSDVSPGTSHEYITLDRLIKYGGSPSCRACETAFSSGRHTPACRARFDALIRADRVGRTPRTPAAVTPAPEAEAPSTPMSVLDEPVEAVSDADPSELPFSARIPPGHSETAMPAKTNTEFDEIFLQANADN